MPSRRIPSLSRCIPSISAVLIFAQTLSPVFNLTASAAQAPSTPPPEFDLSKGPTETPPQLGGRMPERVIACPRSFTYRGKTLLCDSFHRLDGEPLRPILSLVPQAVDELNRYQEVRRNIKSAAYVGTLGALCLLAGTFFSSLVEEPMRNDFRTAMFVAGGVILGGTVTFGVIYLQNNEERLKKAVRLYNEARPDDAITLKFDVTFELY